MLMDDFVHEATVELNRIARSYRAAEYEDRSKDKNGRRVFIADLVVVEDKNHQFNEWFVMVHSIILYKTLSCLIGMPPAVYRETIEDDENTRRNRPRDRQCNLILSQCRVVSGLDP